MKIGTVVRSSYVAGLLGCLFGVGAAPAQATVLVYQNDLAGFNAAAGNPQVAVSFDAIASGTDLSGQTVAGVKFSSISGNSLDVVVATATSTPAGFAGIIDASTNKLPATSGEKVLSPGGVSLVPGSDVRQRDSVRFEFAIGQTAVGIDVLFQSLDCCTFTDFRVLDTANVLIASGSVAGNGGGGGGPGGSVFVGFFSDDATRIGAVEFIDNDDNAEFPDANIGFDTLRLGIVRPTTGQVPVPGVLALLGVGLFGLAVGRRR